MALPMDEAVEAPANQISEAYEVYCDEAYPDLYASSSPQARYLMMGGLWMEAGLRKEVKDGIKEIRSRHDAWSEIKWNRISKSKIELYYDLGQMFLDYGDRMRFRCIAVEAGAAADMVPHGPEARYEPNPGLGFYRFHELLLDGWIEEGHSYRIVCDTKSNRGKFRVQLLEKTLIQSHRLSEIVSVQALPSRQVSPLQLADLLLGAASSRLNGALRAGGNKERIVQYLERGLGKGCLMPTDPSERKYSISRIDPERGRRAAAASA